MIKLITIAVFNLIFSYVIFQTKILTNLFNYTYLDIRKFNRFDGRPCGQR